MSIVKDKTKAFIFYARLSIQNRIGSDGWLRVPSSVSISCASMGDDFDFEAPFLGEYAKYFTSVSVYCEGLSKGFHLIRSSLYSESNWIWWLTPRAIVGSISCASVGDDFDFEVPILGEYAKYFKSVSVHCEGLS